MTPVEEMYRDFCARMAKALEQEANSYTEHPALQDSDHQLIRALWDKRQQWKQQIEKIDRWGTNGRSAAAAIMAAALTVLTGLGPEAIGTQI
jgi:negative regulator of sigma E activity